MKKVIRLTESDLVRIVKKVVNEQKSDFLIDKQSNAIMNATGIRPDKDYKEVNKLIDDAKNFTSNFSLTNQILKLIPLHLRALYYYLIGSKDVKNESLLTSGEKEYLWDVSQKYGIYKGFNYNLWRSLGASKLPTAITQDSIKAETERLKKDSDSVNLLSPGLAGEFMYTLGEISKMNVTKTDKDTILVRDNYDFNAIGLPKDVVIKQFTDTLSQYWDGTASFYSVVRKLVALKEISGYKGYPIQFTIKRPEAPVVDSKNNNSVSKNGDSVYQNFDKTYDYKKVNGAWFAKQKTGTNWINLSGNSKATNILNSKLKNS